jgi:hypothetical protein
MATFRPNSGKFVELVRTPFVHQEAELTGIQPKKGTLPLAIAQFLAVNASDVPAGCTL